jgi:hypothetical protein
MDDLVTPPVPPHVPTVEPELMGSALFLFREYLEQLAAESEATIDDESDEGDESDEDDAAAIETRAVLDLFAEELGTNVQTTLTLYLRVTAFYRLLARSPSLASLAIDEELPGGSFNENALVAAARLDLTVRRDGSDGAADFDPRQFRAALEI